MAGEFDEEQHPRDEKGRFGGGGSGSPLKTFAEKVVRGYKKSVVEGQDVHERAKTHMAREQLGESIKSIQASVGTSLPATHSVGQHVAIAKTFLAKHHAGLQENMDTIRKLAPRGAEVEGRVKTLDSALGKLVRKPKYGTADKLQDGAGLRVVAKTIADVRSTVENIRKNFHVVSEDNYIDKPQGSYRSHHLIVRGKDGLDREVQVRTENQHRMANWSHDTYKPHTPEQREAITKAGDAIKSYEMKMGEHFWAKDRGLKPPTPPPCPPAVKAHFGCLHD